MNYQEFVCAVTEKLNHESLEEIQVKEHCTIKNNGQIREGVLIQEAGTNVCPAIYLEEYYERFRGGESLEQIVKEIYELYQKIRQEKQIDLKQFLELESWKEHLAVKVVQTHQNESLLEEIPHLDYLDLSLIFYLILGKSEEGRATMQITNAHIRQWGISVEQLYTMAMKNSVRMLPAEFCPLPEMICQITGLTKEQIPELNRDCEMYVLSNCSRIQGAVCMFYPHVLEMIGEILKEDYYILPSSVHEVIILPKSRGIPKEDLDSMICQINQTHVGAEEVLSDHAYLFDWKQKEVQMFF